MAHHRPSRTQSQDPSICSSLQSTNQLNLGQNGLSHQLTNYSLLLQQQSKQQEEVYSLKFQLRQAISELDKQKALHQQDALQLKNSLQDIVEQKQRSQEINDILINSLRSAIANQTHPQAYLLEFDYVCDMVRMFTNQQARKKSFLESNVGAETSLEDANIQTIELKSIQTQTNGSPMPKSSGCGSGLTYTPNEKELMEKLQQLEKIARDSRSSKEKSHSQKSELAAKVKELVTQMEDLKKMAQQKTQENSELQSLVEFMKNAGYNQECKQKSEAQAQEIELTQRIEHLQAKYQRKKKAAKERKQAFKAEICSIKGQLAEALKQICSLKQVQPQLVEPLQEIVQTARTNNVNSHRVNSSNQENIQSTGENRPADPLQTKHLTCNVSQFASSAASHPMVNMSSTAAGSQTYREKSRSYQDQQQLIMSQRSSGQYNQQQRQNNNMRYLHADSKRSPSSSNENEMGISKSSHQAQLMNEKLNLKTEQAPQAQLKSHAKLFSKFVNIGKSQPQTQQHQLQQVEIDMTIVKPGGAVAPNQDGTIHQNSSNHQQQLIQKITKQRSDNETQAKPRERHEVAAAAASQGDHLKAIAESKPSSFHESHLGEEINFVSQAAAAANDHSSRSFAGQTNQSSQQFEQSLIESLEPKSTTLHRKQLTTVTEQTRMDTQYPINIYMEDSNDQLVRIEASPQTLDKSHGRKQRSLVKRATSGKKSPIKVSPVKCKIGSPLRRQTGQNKHRSPCGNMEDISLKQANQTLQMMPAQLSLAPVAHIDLSKKRAKASDSLSSGQRYLKQYRQKQQEEKFATQQCQQMLVEEQLSEGRSCSIEHHNTSSSSIEGMIKFGLPQRKQKPNRQQYRSPEQTHNYTVLDRSKSPQGSARDQISHIIDEITAQMKNAAKLNQDKYRQNEEADTGRYSQRTTRTVQNRPSHYLGNRNQPSSKFGGQQQPSQQQHAYTSRERENTGHGMTSSRAKYLTRDCLMDQSCATGNSNCTHYHNHYEKGAPTSVAASDANTVAFNQRLVEQCFDKIGMSLDQLANKDKLIQQLINDSFTSDKKKTGLRRKLKQLRSQLDSCDRGGNIVQDEKVLHQANLTLLFENEHLRDKVEKTQSLLKMYELDSPLKTTRGNITKSRSSSTYELQNLQKMAMASFKGRKSPLRYKKKIESHREHGYKNNQPTFDLSGKDDSLRIPLTDRNQAVSKQEQQQMLLEQQRQQLFRSMINASKQSSSEQLSCNQEVSSSDMKRLQAKSRSREALLRNEIESGHLKRKYNETQKVGLMVHQQMVVNDEQDTRCESNDQQSNGRILSKNTSRQFQRTATTAALAKNAKMPQPDNNTTMHLQSLQFSKDFMAQTGKSQKPNRSRDGFLKVSNHHLAHQKQLNQLKKQETIKSPRERYIAADEEDCLYMEEQEEQSSLPPSFIEGFSVHDGEEESKGQQRHQVENLYHHEDDMHDQIEVETDNFDLPSQVMADRTQVEMNQNNLGQMHERKLVVQGFNKMMVVDTRAVSFQTESDSRVIYDNAAQFRGVQHPKKQVTREQSPTFEEDDSSDKTQPDEFNIEYPSGRNLHSESSDQQLMMSQVSPRNYYYNNH